MEPQPELAAPSISLGSYLRLVRGNGNFRRLWLAQIVSEIGDWFYTLSIYTLLRSKMGRLNLRCQDDPCAKKPEWCNIPPEFDRRRRV